MQDRSEDFLDVELIARRLNARALWNQFIAGITATFACLMLFAVFFISRLSCCIRLV